MEKLSSAQQIDLPEDLIFKEIMPRLSVKHLVRMKLVSKTWRARISTDKTFIANHIALQQQHPNADDQVNLLSAQRPAEERRCVVRVFGLSHDSTNLVELDTSYVRESRNESGDADCNLFTGSCNGLVCLSKFVFEGNRELFLWNPATREFKTLPDPTALPWIPGKPNPGWIDRRATHYLGFDEKSRDYKVLRFEKIHIVDDAGYDDDDDDDDKDDDDVFFENKVFYDVRLYAKSTGRWRQLKTKGWGKLWDGRGQGLVVDGTMYWAVETWYNHTRFHVLSFDLHDESFGALHGPCCHNDEEVYMHIHLIKWKGLLGAVLVTSSGEETDEVWLKSKDENRWTKKCVVDPSLGPVVFYGALGDQLVFRKGWRGMPFSYDLDSHEKRELEGDLERVVFHNILEHVHSLVSPH